MDDQLLVETIGVDEISYREEFRLRKEMRTGWADSAGGWTSLSGVGREIHFLYCGDLKTALLLESRSSFVKERIHA